MSFFDSVKKSLGISKDKKDNGESGRGNDTYTSFRQFEVTFTEERLGIGISKYAGNMPHLAGRENSNSVSCPIVTSFDSRVHGKYI